MKACKQCGSEFKSLEDNQVYCSPKCYKAASNAQAVARYIAKHGALDPKPCAYCGNEYTPKRRDSRYCCKRCNAAFLLENPSDYVSDPDKWQVTTPYGSHAFDGWVKAALERPQHA